MRTPSDCSLDAGRLKQGGRAEETASWGHGGYGSGDAAFPTHSRTGIIREEDGHACVAVRIPLCKALTRGFFVVVDRATRK